MSKSMRYSRRLPYKIPGATHEMYSGCDVISNYSVTLTHIHTIILDENAYCCSFPIPFREVKYLCSVSLQM